MTKLQYLKLELVKLQEEIAAEEAAELAELSAKFKFKKTFEFEESDGYREYFAKYTVFSNQELSSDLTAEEVYELEGKEEFLVL